MHYSKSQSLLLIVNDTISTNMAGPAIRFWEFARVLSEYGSVTLAIPPSVPAESESPLPDFRAKIAVCPTVSSLRTVVQKADVIITLGTILAQYPFLAKTDKPLVLDLYDPFLLAGLHKFASHPLSERLVLNERYRKIHRFQIGAADYIICASEKQRDYWLGMLEVLGRVNPFTSDDDPTLRRLIDVVPFGLPAKPPEHHRQVLKGVYKTIAPQDKVILWGGGIWNWFDAPTMIKAMSIINRHRSDVKLFFMGIKRPNAAISKMSAIDQAISQSQELGLYDQCIFFNDWTPYAERQNYLLEADIGVSLHLDHAEARFSFRTRLLDYLWAGLPILATAGDVLSDVVQQWELGRVVKAGDVEGVAEAVLDMLNIPELRETCRLRCKDVAVQYQWDRVTQPLVDFCLNPRPAPDKAYLDASFWTKSAMVWRTLLLKVEHVARKSTKELHDRIQEYSG